MLYLYRLHPWSEMVNIPCIQQSHVRLRQIRNAHQFHRRFQLILQKINQMFHTVLSIIQREQCRPTDAHRFRPQTYTLQDIRPPPDPTIHIHLHPVEDLRTPRPKLQHRNHRWRSTIQLPTPMITHHYPLHARTHRQQSILRALDPLQDQWRVSQTSPQPRQILPGHTRIQPATHAPREPRALGVRLYQRLRRKPLVRLSLPGRRAVDRQEHGAHSRSQRQHARQQRLRHAPVAIYIQLEEEGRTRRRRKDVRGIARRDNGDLDTLAGALHGMLCTYGHCRA